MSGTGQAQSRASLARNDKKVIMTQSLRGNDRLGDFYEGVKIRDWKIDANIINER